MKTQIIVDDLIYRRVFTRQQIMFRVSEIAAKINDDYACSNEELILLFVRNGGLYFGVDLSRALAALDCNPIIDTVGLRRYSTDNQGGEVGLSDWPLADLSNRHVIVVEDLIDEGVSMNFLYKKLQESPQAPKSISFCALFMKDNHGPLDFSLDYLGWEISSGWVIGNGMDSGQSKGRGLIDVYQA